MQPVYSFEFETPGLPVQLVVGVDKNKLSAREVDAVVRQVQQRRVMEVRISFLEEKGIHLPNVLGCYGFLLHGIYDCVFSNIVLLTFVGSTNLRKYFKIHNSPW